MIARRRGEHDIRQAWWPRRHGRAVTSADEPPGAGSGGRLRLSGGARREPPRHSRRAERRRRMWLLGTLAVVGLTGLGFAAGELVHRPSGRPRRAAGRQAAYRAGGHASRVASRLQHGLASPAGADLHPAVLTRVRRRLRAGHGDELRPLPRPLARDALEAQAHPPGRVHGRARAGNGQPRGLDDRARETTGRLARDRLHRRHPGPLDPRSDRPRFRAAAGRSGQGEARKHGPGESRGPSSAGCSDRAGTHATGRGRPRRDLSSQTRITRIVACCDILRFDAWCSRVVRRIECEARPLLMEAWSPPTRRWPCSVLVGGACAASVGGRAGRAGSGVGARGGWLWWRG